MMELERQNNADAMWLFIQKHCWNNSYTQLITKNRKRARVLVSFRQGFDGTKARCELCNDGPIDIKHLWLFRKDGNKSNNSLSNLGTAHAACIRETWHV